ncbi:MAG: hypothetical protein BZY88_18890 [SAR202 cluster bacterium Io17-Chloro-G9]|nr:MAG: hypothetical protein BZY88_18890 [SAR202 cluster bacterium Io17-Chloro-G9]
MADEEEQSNLPAESPDEDLAAQEGSPEDDSGEPFLSEEDLEGVPPEQRQLIMRAFSSVTGFAGPVFNPM